MWPCFHCRLAALTLDPTGQARGLKAHDEFIRRFLIHVLPDGFHRIRQHANEFNNL